jgi:hypothetical protein
VEVRGEHIEYMLAVTLLVMHAIKVYPSYVSEPVPLATRSEA